VCSSSICSRRCCCRSSRWACTRRGSSRLPRAANPFDFRTIADVLMTFEYTALSSTNYRSQVIQSLNPRVSTERGYDFRSHFPDAWYDLSNPDPATPLTVRFTTRPDDFPRNLEESSLRIDQLLLYFAQTDGATVPIAVDKLTLTPTGSTETVPSTSSAAVSTDDGLISTRAGNWLAGASDPVPVHGTWEMTLAPQMRARLVAGESTEILFVITYSGRTPPWPAA
jgi:hypothetical protein